MTRAPATTSYDEDFYAWTQEQATLLRELSSTGDLDIAHVAEEIEDLGKRDLREVSSFLTRLLEHLIKIDALRDARDVVHWRIEALNFQVSAIDAFSPSMRRIMDVDRLWYRGRKLAMVVTREASAPEPPTHCPLTLDDMLSKDFDIEVALAKFAAVSRPTGA